MTIQTFTYPARVNASGDTQFKVRKIQFGDGYTQVSGDGINNVSQSWNLSFLGDNTYILEIIQFLSTHQGVKSFQWTPPLGKMGLYRCDSYKHAALGGDRYSLTATFEQAHHP